MSGPGNGQPGRMLGRRPGNSRANGYGRFEHRSAHFCGVSRFGFLEHFETGVAAQSNQFPRLQAELSAGMARPLVLAYAEGLDQQMPPGAEESGQGAEDGALQEACLHDEVEGGFVKRKRERVGLDTADGRFLPGNGSQGVARKVQGDDPVAESSEIDGMPSCPGRQIERQGRGCARRPVFHQ